MVHYTMNPNELWHRRFSHLHYKALPIVSKMVTGLPEIQAKPDGVCKGCAQSKNVKQSFPNSDIKDKGVLGIVHSYVCGSMSAASLSGYVYYVSFIDDYSHKTWIYLLKAKNEVFGKFKEFKALVENLTERKLRTCDQTMEVNSPQNNSSSITRKLGLRGNFLLPITRSIIE
jgi:hypothetical protein